MNGEPNGNVKQRAALWVVVVFLLLPPQAPAASAATATTAISFTAPGLRNAVLLV